MILLSAISLALIASLLDCTDTDFFSSSSSSSSADLIIAPVMAENIDDACHAPH